MVSFGGSGAFSASRGPLIRDIGCTSLPSARWRLCRAAIASAAVTMTTCAEDVGMTAAMAENVLLHDGFARTSRKSRLSTSSSAFASSVCHVQSGSLRVAPGRQSRVRTNPGPESCGYDFQGNCLKGWRILRDDLETFLVESVTERSHFDYREDL